MRQGEQKSDSSNLFSLSAIATFNYLDGKYEPQRVEQISTINKEGLARLIHSDSFGTRVGIDCILRINSHAGYLEKPRLLEFVFFKPAELSDTELQILIKDLSQKHFIDSVVKKENFHEAILTPGYQNLDSIKSVCNQLRTLPGIEDVVFIDFFTGPNEQEYFYRLTSSPLSTTSP